MIGLEYLASTFTFFCISLLFVYALVRLNRRINAHILKFGDYLLKTAFPSYSEFEQNKFALLRILFGLIILSRAIDIQLLLIPDEFYSLVGLFSILNLVAAFMVTIGLCTQWTLLFLMFVIWQAGDVVLGTISLGSMVSAMLSLLLFLTSAGRYLSIDSILINHYRCEKKLFLYYASSSDPRNIALAKFAALLAYWAMCVYSLSMHFNEPAWMTGSAGPLLLTNSFMSSWYQFFESLFAANELAVQITRLLLWLMMFWYFLNMPLTLAGSGFRLYVIVWGVLFFTLSLVVLNLGSLAKIEFVFWAAIFWSKRGLETSKKLSVFFDDKCSLCDKTVQIIMLLDIFGRINLKPISVNNESLMKLNIRLEDALTDLYGVVEGTDEVKSGYEFYILLSRNLVLLWPILPVLYLGNMLKIGPLLYRFIADRRRDFFGVCVLPSRKLIRVAPKGFIETGYLHSAIILHVSFLAVCYLIALPAPYVGIKGSVNVTSRAAYYYGIAPINVFNKTDLKMAENWFTLKSIRHDELVPILSDSGERLAMHKSDRVYFGNTLRFHRRAIGKNACVFGNEKEKSIEYLSKVYLHLKKAPTGKYDFLYNQYYQPLPDMVEIAKGRYTKNQKQIKCTILFDVDYSA